MADQFLHSCKHKSLITYITYNLSYYVLISCVLYECKAFEPTIHAIVCSLLISSACPAGTPTAVDEKKVTDLENAITASRRRVDTELRPRLRELEDKEAEQRAAIKRMINDIDTILADIYNLEHIQRSIPEGCYNSPPIERP